MNTKGLSLNTIPPILIPFRFFLTAPIFGMLAAILLLFHGSDILNSRWHESTLAFTHLLTLGFMLMLMLGALYQFIPVMLGQLIPWGDRLSAIIHASMCIGVLSLALGFLLHENLIFFLAFTFLAIALSFFSLSLLPLLLSQIKKQLIVFLLRILFVVLVVTISLGLYMLLAYVYPESGIMYWNYTNTHALWGLVGWVVLLIMAVSSQVIPMFFVTPEFSIRILKILSLLIITMISSLSLLANNLFLLTTLSKLVLSCTLIFFAFYVLSLIRQRRRKLSDVTLKFFYISLWSLILVIVFWWATKLLDKPDYQIQFDLSIGILLIYGLACSAIIGMLQKIVPFLIYLHLQNISFKHPESMMSEPKLVLNMKQIITNKQANIQLFIHLSSFGLLLAAIYWPLVVSGAAILMLCNFSWLLYSITSAFILYSKNKRAIMMFPEAKMDFGF